MIARQSLPKISAPANSWHLLNMFFRSKDEGVSPKNEKRGHRKLSPTDRARKIHFPDYYLYDSQLQG
jgi:hypothetical protein